MPRNLVGDSGEFWQFITNAEHTTARTDQGHDGELHLWTDATAAVLRPTWYSLPLAKWTETGPLAPLPGRTVTTTPITLTASDHVVICDATAAAITVNLPAAADSTGRVYSIKKVDASNNVTVDGSGSETIDGSTTAVLSAQYDAIRIWCSGTEWWIL